MIRVLIADDHQILRSGLALIINEQPDMRVVSFAKDGVEAVQNALKTNPDIVIMDYNMPRKNGLEAAEEILKANEQTKIIIFTTSDDRDLMFRSLHAGALGFLLKSHSGEDLIEAIRTVNKGYAYLKPDATKMLIEDYISATKTRARRRSYKM